VREIAEGRIWMGRAAERLKLVDRVATLDETIEEAKRAAGVPAGRRARVVEYPERGFIRLPWFLGGAGARAGILAPDAAAPRTLEAVVLEQILRHPGEPLLLAPSEALPDEPPPVR